MGAESLLAQTNLPKGVAGPPGGGPSRQAVELGDVAHQVGGLHVAREVVVLGGVAQPGAQLSPALVGICSQHVERAALAGAQAQDQPHEGALARAVGPQQPGYASPDVAVQAPENIIRPVALLDPASADHHVGHCPKPYLCTGPIGCRTAAAGDGMGMREHIQAPYGCNLKPWPRRDL